MAGKGKGKGKSPRVDLRKKHFPEWRLVEDQIDELKRKQQELYPHGLFCILPKDCLHEILLRLPIVDLVNVSLSCSMFRKLLLEEDLWERMWKIRWGTFPPSLTHLFVDIDPDARNPAIQTGCKHDGVVGVLDAGQLLGGPTPDSGMTTLTGGDDNKPSNTTVTATMSSRKRRCSGADQQSSESRKQSRMRNSISSNLIMNQNAAASTLTWPWRESFRRWHLIEECWRSQKYKTVKLDAAFHPHHHNRQRLNQPGPNMLGKVFDFQVCEETILTTDWEGWLNSFSLPHGRPQRVWHDEESRLVRISCSRRQILVEEGGMDGFLVACTGAVAAAPITVIDIRTHKVLYQSPNPSHAASIHWGPGKEVLTLNQVDGSISVWSLAGREKGQCAIGEVRRIKVIPCSSLNGLPYFFNVDPVQSCIVTTYATGSVALYDMDKFIDPDSDMDALVTFIEGAHCDLVGDAQFCLHDDILFTASMDGTVSTWETRVTSASQYTSTSTNQRSVLHGPTNRCLRFRSKFKVHHKPHRGWHADAWALSPCGPFLAVVVKVYDEALLVHNVAALEVWNWFTSSHIMSVGTDQWPSGSAYGRDVCHFDCESLFFSFAGQVHMMRLASLGVFPKTRAERKTRRRISGGSDESNDEQRPVEVYEGGVIREIQHHP